MSFKSMDFNNMSFNNTDLDLNLENSPVQLVESEQPWYKDKIVIDIDKKEYKKKININWILFGILVLLILACFWYILKKR